MRFLCQITDPGEMSAIRHLAGLGAYRIELTGGTTRANVLVRDVQIGWVAIPNDGDTNHRTYAAWLVLGERSLGTRHGLDSAAATIAEGFSIGTIAPSVMGQDPEPTSGF